MQSRMGNVTKVFEQIEEKARTPEEIAEKSGVSISKVKEVLDFLNEFGLVETEGRRVKVSDDIRALPEG